MAPLSTPEGLNGAIEFLGFGRAAARSPRLDASNLTTSIRARRATATAGPEGERSDDVPRRGRSRRLHQLGYVRVRGPGPVPVRFRRYRRGHTGRAGAARRRAAAAGPDLPLRRPAGLRR